tara:strand:- start:73 stop:921 length:849 start_codon:yes stop_codon:yes gene_type:complete
MVDQAGSILHLKLRNSPAEGGKNCGRALTIYCEYWIENAAALSLHFASPSKKDKEAAGLTLVESAAEDYSAVYLRQMQEKNPSLYQSMVDLRASSTAASIDAPQPAFSEAQHLKFALMRRPFMYSYHKVCIRAPNSDWSSDLDLEGRGTAGVVNLHVPDEKRAEYRTVDGQSDIATYQLGVSVSTAPSPFWRTKLVTIQPHIVIHNRTDVPVLCKQDRSRGGEGSSRTRGEDNNATLRVPPGQKVPFHWSVRPKNPEDKAVRITLPAGLEALPKSADDDLRV